MATSGDVLALLRTRSYLALLVLAAALGAPIAAVAYWFLYLVADLQKWLYDPAYLPKWIGFHGEPIWWPLPLLGVAGLLVAGTIRHLPGRGGHSPADGFHPGGPPAPIELPGVVLAAVASLALGAVIGPEAPLIALGGGLAAGAVRFVKRAAPQQSVTVVGVAGSFAALSTLLGSPLAGAFLLMESAGLGGPTLGLVLVPGLVAAGIGSLTFVGFASWTGHGTFSLAIPNVPHFGHPNGAEFGWAIAIGLTAAIIGRAIMWLGTYLRPRVERRIFILTPVVGLAIGALAVAFAEGSGHPSSMVLFSGQSALPSLVSASSTLSVGALVLLVMCKGLAYGLSLGGFRGGPTFPGMFIGAAGGIALSHLPGLPMIAGVAMGMGAMTCVMLNLPLTSVLITTIFLGSDGVAVMPVVIVAVVAAFVARAHLAPPEPPVADGPTAATAVTPPVKAAAPVA